MNKFLATLCLLFFALVTVGSAKAGDFNGFYVGANVGWAGTTSNLHTTTVFSPTGYFATTSPPAIAIAGAQKLQPSAFVGGGQAGYNYQAGFFVLGGEFDINSFSLSKSVTGTGTYPCCAPTGFTVTQSINTGWIVTARPRLGVVIGRVLFYGTGGGAVTNVQYKGTFTDTFASAHENGIESQNHVGWIAGGGSEFRLTHHISIKGEYLHADFGSLNVTSTNLTAFPPTTTAYPSNPFTHRSDLSANIGRAGINFRF